MPRAGCSPSSLPAGDATAETFPCQPPKVHAYRQQSPCRRAVGISTTWVFPLQSGTGRKGGGMALLNFIDRVVIPTALIALFAGGAGGAFELIVGLLILVAPQRLASFEARGNQWYSSRQLMSADEKMPLPLEPHVQSSPRAAGWIIAAASLLVALAMGGLLLARIH